MSEFNNKFIKFHSFKSEYDLNKEFILIIKDKLNEIMMNKNSANIILPGGSSIINFYKSFFNLKLNWDKIRISITDERWVDSNSKDSNEKKIIESLNENKIDTVNFFPLKGDHKIIKHAIVNNNIYLKKILPISILVLGMGKDGHTASFFKRDSNLVKLLSTDNQNITDIASNIDYKRITYTKRALFSAENTYLYIKGYDKLNTLKEAVKVKNEKTYPISAFLNKPISVYWSE
tara:strand:- start:89 stop:787 length:699 start_codon:yes stop_codon:yes gene_type:complete